MSAGAQDAEAAACCPAWTSSVTRGRLEPIGNGFWAVNGCACCDGGCYVLVDLRCCPFCGAAKAAPDAEAPFHDGEHRP